MRLPLVLRAEAEAEFDQAFDWYDEERPGLGAAFEAEVQRSFDRIADLPFACPIVFSDIRKAVLKRFPYCIFYRTHADRIEVLAVFHSSRDPLIWQRRG